MTKQRTTLRLPVIPQPPEGQAAILVATDGFHGPFLTGSGPLDLRCGCCMHLLGDGTRIKHTMGPLSLKLYDKFGRMLRIETTVNDLTFFK